MNQSLRKLVHIASQAKRTIIGLMSGTSMDGLDIALCTCEGSGTTTQLELLKFATISYDTDFRLQLKRIFAQREVDLQQVCLLNEHIGITHANMILSALANWQIAPNAVDLIASHGQTIFHTPKRFHNLVGSPNATLQIGDGDHIAAHTGIITLCDFRQKHVAAGGEGAPLAVYGDHILFSTDAENRILLNIGGIANLTYLPAGKNAQEVLTTDIGPGNTLMDQYIQQHYKGLLFDKDGLIAQKGTINELLLAQLLDHSFFNDPFPKTTGPELFNLSYLQAAQIQSNTMDAKPEDVVATLCSFSARAIIQAIHQLAIPLTNTTLYLSGGGLHHPGLVNELKQAFPLLPFATTESLGIAPDAKEAVLFAILANECVASSRPINFGTNNGIPSIHMGKICLP